ncbi:MULTISPECIES: hypothetical protein [Paenibacillus]|jgi:hypothetical protein|uniref:Uncharacterized protein n=1 Tax=Paenibacillus baimaensis TaxID=2982185 RepID=A0ABT2UAB6_9BACL|nr:MULTISPECIES: hypothetical protein [unclassified Paenibacillus]MCU6791570.1 hypothetical protein [Paenibacillus sp. WQ 127069]OMF16020.1 hypothetical protein BK127_14275 [Paenibacillus sp. FSL H7-0331]
MSNNTYNNEDLKTTVKAHEEFDEQKGSDTPISEVMNGSMAPNMEEIKRLGKDMKNMKTEAELNEEGLVSDPIQNES